MPKDARIKNYPAITDARSDLTKPRPRPSEDKAGRDTFAAAGVLQYRGMNAVPSTANTSRMISPAICKVTAFRNTVVQTLRGG
jgi:hypothetical protein